MPSSYSSSLRFNLQATGENLNLWGALLNSGVFTLADTAIAGFVSIALTSDYTLTSANGSSDEARRAILKFTGTGSFTVTIPAVSKVYKVWNATTGTLTLTTGAGTTVALGSGDIREVFCDGSNVKQLGFGGFDIKTYADNLAFATGLELPGQPGNANKVLVTDGEDPSWQFAQDYVFINDLTEDASPAFSTDYAMVYDASAGANKKVRLDKLQGYTQIGAAQTVSGTSASITFSSIPTYYSELLAVVEGASHNGAVNRTLDIAFSADGSTYSTQTPLTTGQGSSATFSGAVEIPGYRKNAGVAVNGIALNLTSPAAAETSMNNIGWRITGGIAAVRFIPSGDSLDAGTFTLYGK